MMGLAVHIGSQIRELDELQAAFTRLRELAERLGGQGHRVERLDLGGGLGIPYEMEEAVDHGPDLIEAYAAMVGRDLRRARRRARLRARPPDRRQRRHPRHPRADAQSAAAKTVLVVDAAMNDLIRPAMYDAFHDIWPVAAPAAGAGKHLYDVVGPICESGDTFATGRLLAETRPGDLVAFMTAGAYGAVMSSTYNSRLLVPEVLVRGAEWAVVRPRPTFEDLIGLDRTPAWLTPPG